MPQPISYPLGDELEKFVEVQRCDLQHVSISAGGEVLYKQEPIQADLFVWRIIEEYWQSAFHLLSAAEGAGVKTINSSRTIDLCADKAKTNGLLEKAGLPVAKSRFIPRGAWAFPENGTVIKPLDQGGGSGVRMIGAPEIVSSPCLQQEYLGSDRDFARVIFINNEILGFHKRKSLPGSFANNFDLGGEIIGWDAPTEALDLASKAHKLSGAFFSAVDLVETAEEWQVVEINSTPGYRGLVELHGRDIHRQVAKAIASYL